MNKKLLLPALFIMLSSCVKLDSFNGDNSIGSFRIKTYSPHTIILDDARMEGDTLFVPVLYGKYEFPMRFTAEITTSPDINKILGIDFDGEQVFESINSTLKFFVVAGNGSTRAYYIRPREIPLDEDNYIYGRVWFMSVDPGESVLSGNIHMSLQGDTVKMFGAGLAYPVTVAPKFKIAGVAAFRNVWPEGRPQDASEFVNGVTELTFDDEQTVYYLTVRAQSGLEKTWKISLRDTELIEGSIPESAYPSLNVDPRASDAAVANPGWIIDDMLVDNAASTITLTMANGGDGSSGAATIDDPLSINLRLAMQEWADLIYIERDTTFTFTGYDDEKVFYLLDSYGKVSRRWTVRLEEYMSTAADVLSFSYGYTSIRFGTITKTESIVMDVSKVGIYPAQKLITLVYTSYNNNLINLFSPYWGLTLNNIQMTLSDGATCDMPEISWKATGANQANGLVTQGRSFDVVSESGRTTTWMIKLLPANASQSSECSITDFSIERLIPNYTVLDPYPVELNQEAQKIIIRLRNDDASYPLQIFPRYEISEYASITSHDGGTKPLVFADAESVEQVVVTAQNGAASRTYEVSLIPPVKTEGAEILSIDISSPSPAGFSITGAPEYDSENSIITLPVTSLDASFPMEVSYSNIVLSENAGVAIPPQGKFTFTKSTDVVRIDVKAQNGSVKSWYLNLGYRPQLRNWNLDAWSDANTPNPSGYWATPNNTFGKPTSRTTGSDGTGYAANLKTLSILSNLAAGALYLGTFDSGNITGGISDPVSLSFFGVPFAPTVKIKGLMFDIWYQPAGADWASATIELIYWDGRSAYVYHGDKPGATPRDPVSPHGANTATRAVSSTVRFTTVSGQSVSDYGDAVQYIPAATWVKDRFLPIDADGKTFTHLSISFSSSAYGDYLIGKKDSECKVDNIRIVYE